MGICYFFLCVCTHFADNGPLHWVNKFFCGIKNYKRVLKSQFHCDLDLYWPVYSHTVCAHHEMYTKHNENEEIQ